MSFDYTVDASSLSLVLDRKVDRFCGDDDRAVILSIIILSHGPIDINLKRKVNALVKILVISKGNCTLITNFISLEQAVSLYLKPNKQSPTNLTAIIRTQPSLSS